jgi:5-deoxy-glucuronate isomerase
VWDERTLCLRAGEAGTSTDTVAVLPADVGLAFTGLFVFKLPPGGSRALGVPGFEMAVLPLSGSCEIAAHGEQHKLQGRTSVFDAVSDFLYTPVGCEIRIQSTDGGEFAVLLARATREFPVQYAAAASIEVEIRGAGDATRQINNFLSPSSPIRTDKLIGVEVITPRGNFSSYPPHKHDRNDPETGEALVEEIYYFRFSGDAGYGLYRQYTDDGEFDVTTVVRDHDIFLVPRGYHGPSVAVPGHDMYFLNVLAGPNEERTMQYADDPGQHWVRASWADQVPDPRVPLSGR